MSSVTTKGQSWMTQRRRQRTRTCTASRAPSGVTGRAGPSNPVIKVEDLAWLEFEKPDLDAAERFAHDFGFATAARTADTLHLRGARAGTQAVVIRRGAASRFVAPAFKAPIRADLQSAGDGEQRPCASCAARAAAPASTWRTRPAFRCGWSPTWRSCRSCRGSSRWR